MQFPAEKKTNNHIEETVSVSPAGEVFQLPQEKDYQKEFKRLERIVKEQRLMGREIVVVMGVGFVGAVAGHALLGETVSIISFLGLVALAGVVVNDSLVLIDAINRLTRRGVPIHEAVRTASQTRFRAILLTSLTTFLGLVPIAIFETSLQAQFLIPLATSLAFGLATATIAALFLVPAVYAILDDLGWLGALDQEPDELEDSIKLEH